MAIKRTSGYKTTSFGAKPKPVKKPTLGQGTRTERHGKVFDSILEADFYSALLNIGVKFEWQKRVVFFEKVAKNKKVPLVSESGMRDEYMLVDFVLTAPDATTYWIDTKGSIIHAKEKSKLKYRFLKHTIYNLGHADFSAIKWVDTKAVHSLLVLSKSRDKSLFWDFFYKIPNF